MALSSKDNKKQPRVKKNPANAPKKELKNKHFQYPDDVCEFMNKNNVELIDIVPFNNAHCVYYYEKK